MMLAAKKDDGFDEGALDGATPLMAQYLAIKAQNPQCLLFFRLGDFYEMFFEDAVKASRALDIALTRRGQFQGKDIPMCGVPVHAYETYLSRLIRQGFHVALCEQTESPVEAKKRGHKAIVTREVVRIVTPGTITEDNLLEARAANILACVAMLGAGAQAEVGVSWIDLAGSVPRTESADIASLGALLARLDPSEILMPQKMLETPDLFELFAYWRNKITAQPNSRFDSENARRRVLHTYETVDLAAFGDFSRAEVTALGALLDYAALTQKSDLTHLGKPQRMASGHTVLMDPATRRNLELVRTLTGEKQGSLLSCLDRTMTAGGARLLAARLMAPLMDRAEIEARLDAVSFMVEHPEVRKSLREALGETPDMERALARLSLGRGGPRDLASLRDGILKAEAIRSCLLAHASALPSEITAAVRGLGTHAALADKLQRALAAELPLMARDGGFIARGYAAQLDELIVLRDDNRRMIAALQQKYADISGVSALKVRHNQVIGYYIEATPTQADKLMALKDVFIHRQSLASAVRFTTVELADLDRKIAEAADKSLAVEMQIFDDLVADVLVRLSDLREACASLAVVDVSAGLADLSVTQRLARPVMEDGLSFEIKGGRHLVVERALRENESGASFVANDCDLGAAQRLWLLTGPNMAGKSTFLRQNALIALLAQMGSFVPADAARIGLVDRLFSRVGAADDLARGQSTFMVEMVETAAILNQATERSLVILDEIGRGTATYDGLSIAWATIEHLHEVNKCRALFATHYHELTQLTAQRPEIFCATMRIKEWEKEVVFLHQVMAGTADRSYGIHVARMAGLPRAVIARAEAILKKLESGEGKKKAKDIAEDLPLFSAVRVEAPSSPTPLVREVVPPALADFLAALNPDNLSPREALEKLYALKAIKVCD